MTRSETGTALTRGTASPQVMIALLWCAVAACNVALSRIGPDAGADSAKMLATNVCGLAIAMALARLTSSVVRRRTKAALAQLWVGVLAGGAGLWFLDSTLQSWPGDVWPTASVDRLLSLRYNLVYFTLLFCLQTVAVFWWHSSRALRMREGQLAAARIAAQQATLTALRLQLDPHFLFNTLNAIVTLVSDRENDAAEEMLRRLSDFLRVSIETDAAAPVRLADELETVSMYLEIEQIRFGPRLVARFDCEPGLEEAAVPGFILQPLVENAIKFGVAHASTPSAVDISAERLGEVLLLIVRNDLPPVRASRPAGTGTGLRNVAERIEALYGANASLATGRNGGRFSAELRLPLSSARVSP